MASRLRCAASPTTLVLDSLVVQNGNENEPVLVRLLVGLCHVSADGVFTPRAYRQLRTRLVYPSSKVPPEEGDGRSGSRQELVSPVSTAGGGD